MRLSVSFCIVVTTLLLVAVAVMVFYSMRFDLILYTVLFGQAWWIFTVFRVLSDKYTTDKTFDDWYEDHPIGRE
ncbi:hypothetical protein [Salinimicrobium gaetbulicola]|uniref:Uncharacterized protein n=1 Tax=Salinimicrobium gaetbulicola TaxID=999702 RepID=A0ABW3IF50_9FLAO